MIAESINRELKHRSKVIGHFADMHHSSDYIVDPLIALSEIGSNITHLHPVVRGDPP